MHFILLLHVLRQYAISMMKFSSAAAAASFQFTELRKHSDHQRRVISTRLRLHVIPSRVAELVCVVGASYQCSDQHVRVLTPAAVPLVVSLGAADERLVRLVRDTGSGPVVHSRRVPRSMTDQVADPGRVGAQDVVHLGLGEGQEVSRAQGTPWAVQALVGGGEVVGVDGEKEDGARDVLHVVPVADEEEAGGRAVDVGAVLAVHVETGAQVVLSL